MNAALDLLTRSELTWRVGVTLAHTLWQGVVVALLLAVVLRALRTASAGTRHVAACGALLMLLTAPVVTFLRLGHAMPPIQEATWSGSTAEMLPVGTIRIVKSAPAAHAHDAIPVEDAGAMSAWAKSTIPWHAWAVVAWVAGMVALTFWHAAGWFQLQGLRRRGAVPWGDEFATLAARVAQRLRLEFMPCVLWSGRIRGPMAFGCWRPVVLMPMALATGFTMAQIEMILAHEFAHLRRHDYLVNLCQTAATTLLFFNPAVWWINHVIRREREHACDDVAAAAVKDPVGYARALVLLADQEFTGTPGLASAAIGGRGALRRRIERLLHPLPSRSPLRFGPAIFVLLLVGLGWQALPTQPQAARAAATSQGDPPLRGDIRDRNGVVLATNDKESVQIWFKLAEVGVAYAEAHDGTFPRKKREPEMPNKEEKKPPDEREVPDIEAMFNQIASVKLTEAGLGGPYNVKQMRRNYQGGEGLPPLVTPQQARDELAKYGTDFWCYRGDLTSEEEKQARAIASQVPGMSVHILKGRRYPFGALAAHVLGYVNDRDRNTSPTSPDDAYGVYGVEKTQDGLLRPIASRAGEAPRRGSDVYLTLDARHQTIIEETLRIARPTIGRASAVLLEANTGDVLAMASVPSFDPNDFVPSISQAKFEEYNSNKTHPLLNRAVRSYVPGATFLVATSLAAICSGHEDDVFRCSGGVSYGSRYFQCWIGQKGGSHGAMHLQRAIAESCGVFFYQLGNAVGNDGLEKTAALCGLGRHTGIELDEEAGGIFPGRTWWMRNRSRDPFTSGTVANISIGQGAAEATPLQLASLTATVANGGTVWKPRLVNRIAPAGDAPNAEVKPRVRTADLREHGLTESGLAILRGGLENVVQSPEGTAKAAQSTVIRIAGKTGTAQNWRMENNETVKDNHTWFICYAPAEKPRWALAVLVQGGKGGGVSTAPIARQILEQVSAIEAGTLKVEPKPMGPVKGGFDAVEQVVLPPWKMPE